MEDFARYNDMYGRFAVSRPACQIKGTCTCDFFISRLVPQWYIE